MVLNKKQSLVYQRLDIPDPENHRMEFYVQTVDLNERSTIQPEDGIFTRSGEPVTLHSLAVGAPRPALELSEIVAWKKSGLTDEKGGTKARSLQFF